MTGLDKDFASTDFHPYLEYQTPKGVVLPYDTVGPNTLFLRKFRSESWPDGIKIKNLPSESERKLVLGYVASRRGNLAKARSCFSQVEGPSRPQALEALAHLKIDEPNTDSAATVSAPATVDTECK
jgi:hypothetical protein